MNCKILALFSFIVMVFFSPNIFAQLSDYQKFVSYPYLEKTYRLQSEKRYSEAILELNSAIAIAPAHQPYKMLMFELFIANNQTVEALDLYLTFNNEIKGALLSTLIETQIENNNLQLTAQLKQLIEERPLEQRQGFYQTVAARLIAKGQETLIHQWLSQVTNLSVDLNIIQIRLSEKLEKFEDVEKYYVAIPAENRTEDVSRIYAFSLLKRAKTQEALQFAGIAPKSQLSFDIYYQYLQESIAQDNAVASASAFEWLETHHQLSDTLLEQRLEHAIKYKDRKVAFTVMSRLNDSCQKRIEVALSFDWQSKAQEELLTCQNTMQKSLWLTYADILLSNQHLKQLITKQTKYSTSISILLINRYIAKNQYQLAVDEIKRAKLTNSFNETLALSYEKLGQLELATEQFLALYQSTNKNKYLDKITFLLVEQDQPLNALTLLEKRLLADPKGMSKGLVERILQLYQQQPDKLTPRVISSLTKTSHAQDTIAEILRLNGHCKEATSLLDNIEASTALSWTTRALCLPKNEPAMALQYWQKAYEQSQSPDILRALAYAQGALENNMLALKTLGELGEQNWTKADALYVAQLHYQNQNYQAAEKYWLLAKNDTDTWLDFGIELLIQQKIYPQAQSLSTQLLELNGNFSAQQWARQAQIYQQTKQADKAIRAWQIATEVAPDEDGYKISWAYSLIESQPQKAYQILTELTDNAAQLDSSIWEQLGYLATANNQQNAAINYVKQSIATEDQADTPRGKQPTWDLHQFYRDLSQNWHFTTSFSQGTGAILGEVFFENSENGVLSPPTNNLTARAEYFFNTTDKKWSTYSQLSGNGTDDNPLSDRSKELGVSYRIFDQYNVKASLGAQRFFSGDWEATARVNGDLFNQGKWRQGWRYAESWWQRQFYFDLLFLPESDQFLGVGRFDIGYVKALDTANKQTIMYYGLAQYDIRKLQEQTNDQQLTYNQSSLGLGIKWSLFTTPDIVFDRVHSYSLGLEWRLAVSGNLINDNSSVFLIGTYQY